MDHKERRPVALGEARSSRGPEAGLELEEAPGLRPPPPPTPGRDVFVRPSTGESGFWLLPPVSAGQRSYLVAFSEVLKRFAQLRGAGEGKLLLSSWTRWGGTWRGGWRRRSFGRRRRPGVPTCRPSRAWLGAIPSFTGGREDAEGVDQGDFLSGPGGGPVPLEALPLLYEALFRLAEEKGLQVQSLDPGEAAPTGACAPGGCGFSWRVPTPGSWATSRASPGSGSPSGWRPTPWSPWASGESASP